VFANIDWSAGNRYIRTSVDLAGGTNFQLIGTSQLLSVPYALQAKNIPISRVGNSDSIYLGDKLLLIPGVKVLSTIPDINTGLVAWYPFNGNANDSIGKTNNGSLYNTTNVVDRFGILNGALKFNGSNSYVSLPKPFFNGTQQTTFTISTIVYIENLSDAFIWFKDGFWQTIYLSPDLKGAINFGGSIPSYNYQSYKTNDNVVKPGQWYNIIVTFNNTNSCIYLNGTLVATNNSMLDYFDFGQTASGNSNNINLFGCRNSVSNGNTQFFNGIIDDFRLYNRVLTQAEITYLATH
jgi:hypothetical protein